ncbi:PhoPQ-activated pathogenicity-related protein [Endozoicomonas sp. NE35]
MPDDFCFIFYPFSSPCCEAGATRLVCTCHKTTTRAAIMTKRPALLPLLSLSWLLALSFFSCFTAAVANNHLKTPQNDCSAKHLKQHPRHILPCYLQKPDNHYHWQATETSEQTITVADKKKTITAHSIEMRSQRWPVGRKDSVNHPVWLHRITVYQPEKVVHDSALLFINGGRLYY